MFLAKTGDPKTIRDCIDAVSQIIDEGLFRITKDGMRLVAADRAMVAVIDLNIKASAFDSYTCDSDVSAGLNLQNLLTILKRAGNEDRLVLGLNSKDSKFEIE